MVSVFGGSIDCMICKETREGVERRLMCILVWGFIDILWRGGCFSS